MDVVAADDDTPPHTPMPDIKCVFILIHRNHSPTHTHNPFEWGREMRKATNTKSNGILCNAHTHTTVSLGQSKKVVRGDIDMGREDACVFHTM